MIRRYIKFVGLILVLLMVACQTNTENSDTVVKEQKKLALSKSEASKLVYLSQKQLWDFVDSVENIEMKFKYKSPFDTLTFNKVIAYDFDGNEEPYPSVVNIKENRFAPVVVKQQNLSGEQIDFLINFLTNNKSYGEATASCFIPHLGFVFYENDQIKLVINVCLDCNYLISSTKIPATEYKRMKFEDGTSYGLRGFSRFGTNKIITLGQQLNFNYGNFKLRGEN